MKRSTLFAVAVFTALLIGTVISLKEKPERGISRISLEDVDTAAIDRIEVSGDKPVEVRKEVKDETDESWRLKTGKEASADAIKGLLSNITKITSSDLVTRDPERFAELEVGEEKGARVTAYAGDRRAAQFVVGSSASGGGTHIRVGDEVYRVKGVYRSAFAKPASSWQQLKLFTNKALADVTRVQVQLADAPAYAVVKKGNDFELEQPPEGPKLVPDDFRFDKNAARSLASNMVNLRAKEILDKDPGVETTKLDDNADRVRLYLKASDKAADASSGKADEGKPAKPAEGSSDGATATADADDASGQPEVIELLIGAETDAKDGTAYAKVAGRDDVVILQAYSVKSLRKKATDLRDLKLVDLDTAKVTKLSIRKDKMRLDLEKQGVEWKIAKSSEKIPKDFELDPTAVTRRISQLSSARAARLAERQAIGPSGLARPKANVEATLEGGKRVTLAFGADTKDDNKDVVFAKGNIDGKVYLANKWTFTNLTGGLDTFKKKPEAAGGLANMDPKALSGLPPDVRKSLEQQMRQKSREQEMLKTIQAKMAREKKDAGK